MQKAASHTAPPNALDALKAAVLNGRAFVPVDCPHCGEGLRDGLVLVDRDADERRSERRAQLGDVVVALEDDYDEEIGACPSCDGAIFCETVVLRDRRGRCAAAMRERRGMELRAALRTGGPKRVYAILAGAA